MQQNIIRMQAGATPASGSRCERRYDASGERHRRQRLSIGRVRPETGRVRSDRKSRKSPDLRMGAGPAAHRVQMQGHAACAPAERRIGDEQTHGVAAFIRVREAQPCREWQQAQISDRDIGEVEGRPRQIRRRAQ